MKVALVSLSKDAFYLPIGLVYIATYLEKKKGFSDTVIVDARFDDIHKRLQEIKPDLVGISAMTFHYCEATKLAAEIKKYSRAQIAVGGFHVSLMPHSLHEAFDFGIMGEGEETFSEVVEAFDKRGPLDSKALSGIPGLVFRDENGGIAFSPERPMIQDLDDIPVPDMKFVDRRYFKPREEVGLGMIAPCGPLLTARGCPYKCVFCADAAFWKRYRSNSAEYVVKNIEHLMNDCGVSIINIHDDMFSVNKKRIREIRDLMGERGILGKVTFTCNARSNHIDDEMCELLASMNVRNLFFGFESGSEKVLKYLKVGSTTVEKHKEAIKTCKRHGLIVYGSLIFGSPGETIQDMRDSLDFIDYAIKEKADALWSFVATPYPRTGFWEEAKKRGKVSDDMDWEKFNTMSHYVVENPPLSDVDPAEFKKVYDEARHKLRGMRIRLMWKFVLKTPKLKLVSQVIKNVPYYAERIYYQIFHY